MKNLRKLVVVVLVLALALLSFGACGEKTDATNTEVPKKESFKIGISQPFMGHPIRKAGTVLIDAWAAEHPDCEIIVTDGQLNANKQINDIEDLIAQEVDVILVAAHQSPTLVSVLQKAHDAGIAIIAFDRILTDKSVQVSEVINDDVYAGRASAELIVEGMGETGKVICLEGVQGNTITDMRQSGFEEEISKYPGIEIIEDQPANFQRVQAVDLFENLLQANPDVTGVYCHNDEMALGVCKVLKDHGRTDVTVVGIDGQKDALETIIAGDYYGSVRKVVEFPASLDVAYEYLTTGKCDEQVILNGMKVNSNNVNDVYDPDAVF